MKIVLTAWISKSAKDKADITDGAEVIVFTNRGKADEWHPTDWPPRKVKVTIEDYKTAQAGKP
jgi:hypothetical protein